MSPHTEPDPDLPEATADGATEAAATVPEITAAGPEVTAAGPEAGAAGPPAPLDAAAVAALLGARFPALFGGAARPIKLHIQADIQSRLPGLLGRRALSAFLHRHTGSTAYLVALSKATHRFDLDGQPAGELSAEHRDAASQELARRRALRNERMSQDRQRLALEDQQRRNRAGLLRDFERTTLTRANFCVLKGVADDALDGLLEIARRERDAPSPAGPARLHGAAGATGPARPGDARPPRGPRPPDAGPRAGRDAAGRRPRRGGSPVR